MSHLKRVEISAAEGAALEAGQAVAEAVWLRFRKENDEGFEGKLDMKMEIAPDAAGKPHAWWKVRPSCNYEREGYAMSLPKALDAMHAVGEKETKLKAAQKYREAAERLELDAAGL